MAVSPCIGCINELEDKSKCMRGCRRLFIGRSGGDFKAVKVPSIAKAVESEIPVWPDIKEHMSTRSILSITDIDSYSEVFLNTEPKEGGDNLAELKKAEKKLSENTVQFIIVNKLSYIKGDLIQKILAYKCTGDLQDIKDYIGQLIAIGD